MKRLIALLAVAVCLSLPVWAAPLEKGDQALAFDVSWQKPTSGPSETDVIGTWYFYTGGNQRTGATILYNKGTELDGQGAGPSYDLLMPLSDNLRLVLGGDLALLQGGLQDAADAALVTRLGVEWTVGKSGTAIRFMPRYVKAVNQAGIGTGAAIDQYGFTIGILLGIPAPQTP